MFLVLGIAQPVWAAELHWDAPEACPDVRALELEAERALGEPLAKFPLQVVGTVRPSDDQLVLSLRITLSGNAEPRERELRAASCHELLEAAALAIALAAADSGERSKPPVPQSRDVEGPARPVEAEPVPQRYQLALSAAGAAAWGALPTLGFGGELQVAWLQHWFRVGLGATWFPRHSTTLADARAGFGLYFLELLLCGQGSAGRGLLFGCATASIGRMEAHLDAPAVGPTESTTWRTLGVRVGMSYPVAPPLELTAAVTAAIPLTRPRFYSEPTGAETIHQPASVAMHLLVGILLAL